MGRRYRSALEPHLPLNPVCQSASLSPLSLASIVSLSLYLGGTVELTAGEKSGQAALGRFKSHERLKFPGTHPHPCTSLSRPFPSLRVSARAAGLGLLGSLTLLCLARLRSPGSRPWLQTLADPCASAPGGTRQGPGCLLIICQILPERTVSLVLSTVPTVL